MRARTTKTLQERLGGVRRFIRALDRDVSEWEPDDLIILRHLEAEIDRVRSTVIRGLRETGYTDREIADALGVTQQAVSKRWPGGGRYVGAAGRYRQPKEA